jgi:hypothetical protein
MRINDARLPATERNTALQQLAAKARTQLTATLGANVANIYATTANWVTALDRGYSIRITPDGQVSYYMGPPPR